MRSVPEGLAVMFEPDGSDWATSTLSTTSGRIPLDRLAGSFDDFSGNQARIAYAESADAARRLFNEIGGAGVVSLLQDIARGVPLGEAFERRIVLQASVPTAARQKGGRYAGSRFAARIKMRDLNVGSLYRKRTTERLESINA